MDNDDCKYLQKFYVETRYPVVWEAKYSREDALKAKAATDAIIALVRKFLPG